MTKTNQPGSSRRQASAKFLGLWILPTALAATTGCAVHQEASLAEPAVAGIENMCRPEAIQAVVASLKTTQVTIKQIEDGPFKAATRFVPAKGDVPAYCQVTGSFVTNAKTGKTANFLATFPGNWNGKYLQIGCSSHCGQFYVSDAATPSIIVTTQGQPTQILRKGYASFATDEGHVGMDGGQWAVRPDGTIDQDYLDDFFYRAQATLADLGKEFSAAFYGRVQGRPGVVKHSYFSGCSGGGRDAFVAASYFPEKFDGIIGGSAYNLMGVGYHVSAVALVAARSGGRLSPASLNLLDQSVKAQCDAADGVRDGLIQNPAACNIVPERDLPRCADGKGGDQCFTPAQIDTISTVVTALTDERGNVVQPGYSISELAPPGVGNLTDAMQKIFVHKNDPAFTVASNYTFKRGGPGPVSNYRAVVRSAEIAHAQSILRGGIGHLPENFPKLMNSRTKFMIWHNWSDEQLSPYMSVNYYKRLAQRYGGYGKVQDKVRLFMLPGTSHCSISSVAPNGFDALSAMENWVEKGQAPNALMAFVRDTQFSPGAPKAEVVRTHPNWTMPLCKFPEMARYKGSGDMKDGRNWQCPAGDRSLLRIGESGRQAGVFE